MPVRDVPAGKRRSRKPFELGFDPAVYTPTGLGARNEKGEYLISDADLKKEYARLRREATERLRKLGAGEFKKTKTYRENKDRFLRLEDIAGRKQGPLAPDARRKLERLTQEAARFVTAKGSSASGLRDIRRKAIKTLHESGYTFVNTRNYDDWTDYLDWLHAQSDKTMFYEVLKADEEPDRQSRKEAAEKQRVLFEQWQQGEMTGQLKEEPKQKPKTKTRPPRKKKYRSKG